MSRNRQNHVNSGHGSLQNGIRVNDDYISGREECEIPTTWACPFRMLDCLSLRGLSYSKSHIENVHVLTLGI